MCVSVHGWGRRALRGGVWVVWRDENGLATRSDAAEDLEQGRSNDDKEEEAEDDGGDLGLVLLLFLFCFVLFCRFSPTHTPSSEISDRHLCRAVRAAVVVQGNDGNVGWHDQSKKKKKRKREGRKR